MTRPKLRTCSSGRYWQGEYRDADGKRCFINGIGTTAELSKRQAQKILDDMDIRDDPEPMTVSDWCERYLDTRADLGENTRELINSTCIKLRAELGSLLMTRVTTEAAEHWRSKLAMELSPSTVYAHVHRARAIFAAAVRHKVVIDNPFALVRVAKPAVSDEWRYVTMDEFERIIAACPDAAWRNLFALCRLCGCRSGARGGEALDLRWSDIDFAKKTIKVTDQKRKTSRLVPMSPRLAEILNAGRSEHDRVCPITHGSVDRKAREIIKAAGIEAYSKPFHSLRKALCQDWLSIHPPPLVVKWTGHSHKVAMESYHRADRPQDLERVSG